MVQICAMPRITKNEGNLFIFAPRTSADGLVSFDDLRNLYKFIFSLIRGGHATAVRAATRAGIEKAIEEMTGGATLSDFSLPPELIEKPIGAFIVESNENLSGLRVRYTKNSANNV